MAVLELNFFGGFQANLAGEPVVGFESSKVRALLAYLVVENRRPQLRSSLAGLLWPDWPQQSAMSNLRYALADLRKNIGDRTAQPSYLLISRESLQFNLESDCWLDVDEFDRLSASPEAGDRERAAELYQGAFLEGFVLNDSPAFEEWILGRREAYQQQALVLFKDLADQLEQAGDFDRSLVYARRQLDLDSWLETAHVQVMRLLAAQGQVPQALRQYQILEEVLKRELDTQPSAETRRLYQEIQAGVSPVAVSPSIPRHAPLPIGTVLQNRFRLDTRLGEGSTGLVYQAYDLYLERDVAVKVMYTAGLPEESRKRLLNEAQAAARLSHPNIVTIFDAGEGQGFYYIVMELVRGPDLRQQRPSNLDAVISIGCQISAALEHAHAHQITHRDLGLQNVLLAPDGNVKLADFGMARSLAWWKGQAGISPERLAYLAPELLKDQDYDTRADLYSLGMLLYELSTGRLPFSKTPHLSNVQSLVDAGVTPPESFFPGMPVEFNELVLQLLNPDPARRPASASEVRQRLEKIGAPAQGKSPYKGLEFFNEGDAELFYGRERLVGHLVDLILGKKPGFEQDPAWGNFLAVVGASGSGKSSLLRAGLVPALRRHPASQARVVVVMMPGPHPLENLALELTRQSESLRATTSLLDDMLVDSRSLRLFVQKQFPQGILLVIDQFEETFTLNQDEIERQAFIDNLMESIKNASSSPICLVVALRADFYAACAPYEELRLALAARQEYIGAMTAEELRQVIEKPAAAGGWELEPGLVDLFLRDVGAAKPGAEPEPGALPLLSHALYETWKRRRGRTLVLAGYAGSGGVRGAITHTAESVYAGLNPGEQAIARNIFLRLAEPGEGAQVTRRRANLTEVLPGPERDPQERLEAQGVLQKVVSARLVTTSEQTAEVAHEALIREWARLKQWLDEDREGLRLHHRLTEAAYEWERLENDPSSLYRGARLAQSVEWAEAHSDRLSALESEFLSQSRFVEQREAVENEKRRQQELQAAQKLAHTQRQRSLVLSIGLAISIFLIGLAAWLYRSANSNLGLAEKAQQTAQAEALSRATQQARAEDESLRRATQQVLAEESRSEAEAQTRLSRSRELAAAAVNTLSQDPQLSLLLALEAYATSDTLEAESALHRAVQASHVEKILAGDAKAGERGSAITSLAYNTDGSLLAAVNEQKELQVFKTDNGERVYTYRLDEELIGLEGNSVGFRKGMPIEVEFFPDGSLALESTLWFVILDAQTGQELIRATAGGTTVLVTDHLTGEELFRFEHTTEGNMPIYTEYASDGLNILVYNQNKSNAVGEINAYNLATGAIVISLDWERGSTSSYALRRIEYSPDGRRLMVMPHQEIEVWDLASGQLAGRLNGAQMGDLVEAVFSSNGERLAVRDASNSLKAWQVDTGAELLNTTGKSLAFSPGGDQLVVTDSNQRVSVWNLDTRRVLYDFLCNPSQSVGVLDPAGQQLASGGVDGVIFLCEVSPDYALKQWVSGDLVLNYAYAQQPSLLGIASVDNLIRLYDAETGDLFKVLESPSDSRLIQFEITQDGSRIVTSDNNGTIDSDSYFVFHVWETATGKELVRSIDGSSLLGKFDLNPDGDKILNYTDNFLSNEKSTDDFSLLTPALWLDWSPFTLVGYNLDGSLIALAKADGRVSVLDTLTHSQVFTSTLGNEPTSMAFHPDDSQLAVSTVKGAVVLLDVQTGKTRLALPVQPTAVQALAFSPDGSLLAMGSTDGLVSLWDMSTDRKKLDVVRHDSAITFLAFTSAGDRLISGSQDGVARLTAIHAGDILALAWQRTKRSFTPQELQTYYINSPLVNPFPVDGEPLAHTPARSILLPAIPETNLPVFQAPIEPGTTIQVANVKELIELGRGYVGSGEGKAISPDGLYFASSSGLTFTLFDFKTMQPVWRKSVGFYVDREISFSPDGSLIAAGGDHGDVHILRTVDGTEILLLKGHNKLVRNVKFSPDGKLLASASQDDLIQLWSMPDGELVGTLANDPYAKGVWSIDFSPDGAYLLSGSTDGKVRIWDLQRQVVTKEYTAGAYIAANVDYSPDGKMLVTDDWSGTVGTHAKRVEDGSTLFPLQGSVAMFSPDGRLILTYGFVFESDTVFGEIYLHDAQDGKLIHSIIFKPFGPSIMGFSPDMRYLYVQTWDGVLHLWGVP